MNEFCAKKGIKREYSIARTPQQNGVAERKNRTLIETARTMLADSLLPIQFWAEAVNTACYVLNRVLVTKPQMKTPYEILMGRSPNISFMRPFGCPLTILNTLDQLGKFDGKSEEGYLLGYSTNSKGFRVYNRVTRKVQDCLHVNFLENQENQKGKGPDWMFDLELLTPSMNYIPVRKENYADSGGKDKHSEEYTADKEVPLSSEEQALHDELVSLMHQESIAKVHNDAQRNAFEKEKRKIALEKGKECVDSTFTLSTANTPSQSTGNTPTDSDDDVPKDGVFSTNSFDDENTDTEEVEGVDDNEVFAPVLELKQSGIFLAFALSWALLVSDGCQKLHFYMATSQYDCTSAASGFEDTTSHPNKVYRVVKAYYGLHQSPKAWSYDWMSMYFLNLQTSHNVCCLSVCTVSSHSKGSHIHAVNRIFRSTSGGCQYLGMKMVYWQCKKTTIVAISSTEANLCSRLKVCCAQIRHHFIRDCYEQRLINVVKEQLFGTAFELDLFHCCGLNYEFGTVMIRSMMKNEA
ncbi:retrovirus-related pol polyprotein from transposon TNT 1-94 [Tanacetum coccineum]